MKNINEVEIGGIRKVLRSTLVLINELLERIEKIERQGEVEEKKVTNLENRGKVIQFKPKG